MEDEKEELEDTLQSLQNDYGNFGVGMELLEEQIYGDISYEEVGKLVEDLYGWIDSISDCVDSLDEAKENCWRNAIINGLGDENET